MEANNTNKATFTLFTFSHALIHVFPASLAPLLPLIRAEFNLSYTGVGILTFILSLCWAFSGVPAGLASDRIDKTKLILTMFLLVSIFSSTMILIPTLSGVLLLLILLFLSIGIFHPSAYSYLSDRYSKEKGKVFGIFEAGGSIGILIAPLVAGVIGSYFGWRYVYTFWAMPAFAMAFLFYRFSLENKLKDVRTNKGDEEKKIKESLRKISLFRYPHFKAIYLAQGFFGFVVGGSVSFLPLFLTDVRKLSVSTAGGMLALFLGGGLVGKMIGGRYSDIWGPRRIIETGFFITSFFLILIPLTSGFSLVLVLLPAGIAFSMILPALFLLTGEIKITDLGLVYGIQLLSGAGFGACSRLVSGVVSDLVGIEYVFLLPSAVAFVAAIFTHFYLK